MEDKHNYHLLHIDTDQSDIVFSALSSTNARRLLTLLHEEPRTITELAQELDTTLQTVQYHLSNLVEADLIEVTDTKYSVRGAEMDIYAPTAEATILFSGPKSESDFLNTIKESLGIVIIGGALLLFIRFYDVISTFLGRITPEFTGDDQEVVTPTPTPNGQVALDVWFVDPSVTFVAGALVTLIVILVVHRRNR